MSNTEISYSARSLLIIAEPIPAVGVSYSAQIGGNGSGEVFPAAVTFTNLPYGVTASYNPANGVVNFAGSPGLPVNLASSQSFFFGFSYTAPLFGMVP